MAHFAKPGIFNTNPGSQFASREFTTLTIGAVIKSSVDGKGAEHANVFVERILKSVKYKEVYLRAYASMSEARAFLARDLAFYNPRQPLGRQTLDQAYLNAPQSIPVAANQGPKFT
jgi:putative transposase